MPKEGYNKMRKLISYESRAEATQRASITGPVEQKPVPAALKNFAKDLLTMMNNKIKQIGRKYCVVSIQICCNFLMLSTFLIYLNVYVIPKTLISKVPNTMAR